MAVLTFCESTDKLSFSIGSIMGAEDAEGFCFHRKNEWSAVMAVTEQKKSSYDELVRNEKSTHQCIEKQYPQRFSYCQSNGITL